MTPRTPCSATVPCRVSTCIFFDECDYAEGNFVPEISIGNGGIKNV